MYKFILYELLIISIFKETFHESLMNNFDCKLLNFTPVMNIANSEFFFIIIDILKKNCIIFKNTYTLEK